MDDKLLTHSIPKTSLKVNFSSSKDAANENVLAEKVTVFSSTESGSPASRKIFAKDLTRYDWEQKYHLGNLVTSNSEYFAYALRGLQTNFCVRIMNRTTGSKTLIKNFVHNICDLAFASHSNVILGAVDVMGNFSIWELRSKSTSSLDYSVLWSVKSDATMSSDNHRLKWQPIMEPPCCEGEEEISPTPLFVITNDKCVNVFDLELLAQEYEDKRELELKDISAFYICIKEHEGVITDCDVSPDGQILATVSEDGCMKCFQLRFNTDPPSSRCLQNFRPHDQTSKLSSLLFCDNHRDPNTTESFWRFFVTGADYNREIKLWCASTWNLLQTIKFDRDPHPMMKAAIDPTGWFVILTDVLREVLYILSLKKHQNKDKSGYAAFFVCTEYVLSSPILSFTIWGVQSLEDEDDGSAGYILKMTSINTKTMQELEVRVTSEPFDPSTHMVPKAISADKKQSIDAEVELSTDNLDKQDNASVDDDFEDVDSINGELGGAQNEEETIDLDEIEEDNDNSVLLGPNSFGPGANGDTKVIVTATSEENIEGKLAAFESWDDDQSNTLTNVTRSPPNIFEDSSVAPSADAFVFDDQNTSGINDSVMKLFQTPQDKLRKDKHKSDAEALKALIGIGSSNHVSDRPKRVQPATENSHPAGDLMRSVSSAPGSEVQFNKRPEVDLSEVLHILKSIQQNQTKLEARLDKLSVSSAHAQKETKTALKDHIALQVKNEIKTQVVPAVNKMMKPMGDGLNTLVSQKLTSTDAVLKEQVKKMVSSKQISDNIGKQAATCVEGVVNQKCRELFEHQLAPRFASAMESSSKQIGLIFTNGTGEYLRALEAHGKSQAEHHKAQLDAHVSTVQRQLGHNQSEIQKIVKETVASEMIGLKNELHQSLASVQKQIVAEVQSQMAEQNRSIQAQFRFMQRQVATATPLPEGAQQNHVDLRPLVEEELKKQNFDKAFEMALTAGDVQLVLHVCESVGTNIDKPTFKMGIPNILALLQQISCNLHSCNRVELRLHVLEATLSKLDPAELCKFPKFDRSLSALERELVKYNQGKGRMDPFYGKVRILASATRELSAETKSLVS